jgi:glycosyltransferase involved in cell wall biosynthesis
MSLRILHVTPYYAPAWGYGGVVSAVAGLAAAQAERGHHVTVLTTDALGPNQRHPIRREAIDHVEVIRCRNLNNALRARYNLSWPVGFRRVLDRLVTDADVVQTHELRTVENLLLNHRKPVVLSPHGTLSHETGRRAFKRAWDRLFGRTLLRKMDHIAALTAIEAKETRGLWDLIGVPFPGASIIPNGVPADFAPSGDLRSRYGLGHGPVVLFLGRLHQRKGLQYLIPAFARVAGQFTSARLLIVGPDAGMLSTAQSLVAQAGIMDRVTFTGMLGGSDQRAAFASADLFVLPAVGEGLSMAVLEAMAAGLPLILTPGCNLPDLETQGAGLLAAREVEPLAGALSGLLADADRRRVMGERGRAWVLASFTWPAIAAQYDALYAEVCERWKSGASPSSRATPTRS